MVELRQPRVYAKVNCLRTCKIPSSQRELQNWMLASIEQNKNTKLLQIQRLSTAMEQPKIRPMQPSSPSSAHASRLPTHCPSPFHAASSIPMTARHSLPIAFRAKVAQNPANMRSKIPYFSNSKPVKTSPQPPIAPFCIAW